MNPKVSVRLRNAARRAFGRPTNTERNAALSAAGVLDIGRYTYQSPMVRVWGPPARLAAAGTRVEIGSFCSIGPDVEFLVNGQHRTDWVTTFPLRLRLGLPGAGEDGTPAPAGRLVVGNDVWIGARSTILGDLTIGHGAVIAAGSVVTSDVRPYAVVGGVPAREIRRRFDDDTVDRLIAVAWWNWPVEEIRVAVDRLSSDDIDGFLQWAEEHTRSR